MEKELDSEVIKLTQTTLGKYVKRPPLSEKLLKKPPFRFLHDIVTAVLKTTGFFENLFDDEELVSDNVKDRDSKISFLTKVIFVISSTTGKSLSVKPSKIVSGQEPDKTNELLQCLAQALDNKLTSEKAVKQYKENLKLTQSNELKNKESNKPLKKGTDAKKLTSRSTEKLTNPKLTKQDKEKSVDVKAKRKENGTSKNDAQNKKTQPSKTVVKKNTKEQKDDNTQKRTKTLAPKLTENEKNSNKEKSNLIPLNKHVSQESDVSLERNLPDEISNVITTEPSDTKEDLEGDKDILNTSYTINDNGLNSSASSTDILETNNVNEINSFTNNHVNTTENKSFVNEHNKEILLTEIQPTNIDQIESKKLKSLEIDQQVLDNSVDIKKEYDNKVNDKVKSDYFSEVKTPDRSENEPKIMRPSSVRPASVRPSSSRPGAPRMREKTDNVIKDPDSLLMGKVNIIVENTQHEEEDDSSLIIIDQAGAAIASQDQQELQLTSNEHGHLVQQILESQKELSQNTGKTEIEWQLGAQKAREAVNQDIEQLRFSIQALSRVANPLGKLLDHIQEDVEVMRQELQQWSNIYEDVNKDMLKQKTITEDALMPFHTKLKQLEVDIEEKHDKINDLKILIHKNASRIEKLLTSGNVQ